MLCYGALRGEADTVLSKATTIVFGVCWNWDKKKSRKKKKKEKKKVGHIAKHLAFSRLDPGRSNVAYQHSPAEFF